MPLISVIVPVYKVEPYLRRCVDSILSQTFTDFELILVDDGSPDNCGAICDDYTQKDSRVHVIHQENGGLSAARNAGIDWAFANSDSQWISFVDSDDWVHPDYLKVLLDVAETGHTEIAITELYRTTQYEMKTILQPRCEFFNPKEYYLYAINETDNMSACGKLYRRNLFISIRFPNGRIWEDLATTYKLLFSATKIAFINREYQYYYYNNESITHARWTQSNLDELKAYEEQIKFFKCNRQYDKIQKALQRRYIQVIGHHVINMERTEICDKQKILFRNLLRRKMRHAIIVYGRNANISYPEYSWELEIAFPKGMQTYWLFSSQISKLRKIISRKKSV